MSTSSIRIKFLGTGGAFDVAHGNSAAIIALQGKHYLIDCGHSIFPRIVQQGVADLIDGVFITHLHDDHVGSLSSFALYHTIVLRKPPLKVFVPNDRLKELLNGFLAYSLGDPLKHIDFRPMSEVEGAGFIDTYGRHVPEMQTYAYYFTDGQESIVYSGDNGDVAFLFGELEKLKLPNPIVFHEIFFFFRMFSHAYYEDLMTWTDRYRIYGYHCDPQYSPAENAIPLVVHHRDFLY